MYKRAGYLASFCRVCVAPSLFFAAVVASSCSVQKNNIPTRLYHRLTSSYNLHYNAQNSFDEAYLALLEKTNESYAQPIAIDLIAYQIAKNAQSGASSDGSGSFTTSLKKAQRAIKEHSIRVKPERKAGWRKDPKAVAEQAKTEYNDVLYKSWLLVGKSQLYNASVDEAMATFAYIARLYKTEPRVRDRALLWEIRCLSMAGRASEAKQIWETLGSLEGSHYQHLKPLYTLTMAEYLIASGQSAEAVGWLKQSIKYVRPKGQKARLWYLLGQLHQRQNYHEQAYEAYSRVLLLSPRSDLDFAARIRRAELGYKGKDEVIKTLLSMAGRSKYSKQLDQIYYAIGRTHLHAGDTTRALSAFRFATDTSQLKGEDYALANLALAEIHLLRMEYLPAREAYKAAIPLISPLREGYHSHVSTARGLDSLAPSAEVKHTQDSLLRLVAMPEEQRLHVIDSVITSLKQKEREEAAAKARDSIANLNRDANARVQNTPTAPAIGMLQPSSNGAFYFYNPALLAQGRKDFERNWGRRPLEDMWRLRKKDDLFSGLNASNQPKDAEGSAGTDLTSTQGAKADNAKESDPHYREYYLAQLPFSQKQREESLAKVEASMVDMGRILVDQMDRLSDASNTYYDFLRRFPQSPSAEHILYRLYLIHLRLEEYDKAEEIRLRYIASYPNTSLSKDLAKPGYIDRLRQREGQISHLYTEAYEAYRRGESEPVHRAYREVKELHPTSELLPQLLFLSAMAEAMTGNTDGLRKKLEELEATTPTTELRELADYVLSGIKSGRAIYAGGHNPINWSQHVENDHSGTSIDSVTFASATKQDVFAWLILPEEESQASQVLYLMATYNFTQHTQRNIAVRWLPMLKRTAMAIEPFATLEAARQYAEEFVASSAANHQGSYALIPITQQNLSLLTSDEALQAYEAFVKQGKDTALGGLIINAQGASEKDVPKTDEAAAITSETEQTESVDLVEEVSTIPRESGLHKETISYDDAQKALRQREQDDKAKAKAKEKERKAEQAAREREKRDREKAKLQAKREKERERIKVEREKKKQKVNK